MKSGIYCEAKINKSNYKTKLEEAFSKNDKFIIQTNDPNLEYIACLIGLKNNCSVKFITTHCGSYMRYLALGIDPQIRDSKVRIQSLRQTIQEILFSKNHELTCYDDAHFQHIIQQNNLSVTNDNRFNFFSRKIFQHENSPDNFSFPTKYFSNLEYEHTTEKDVSKRASFINILKRKEAVSHFYENPNEFFLQWCKIFVSDLFKLKKSIYYDKVLLYCFSIINNIEEIFINILEENLQLEDSPKNFAGFTVLIKDLERIKVLTDDSNLLNRISEMQTKLYTLHKKVSKKKNTYLPDEILKNILCLDPNEDTEKILDFITDNISKYFQISI